MNDFREDYRRFIAASQPVRLGGRFPMNYKQLADGNYEGVYLEVQGQIVGLPGGVYPDDEDLLGLTEEERYFFHYADFGNLGMIRQLHENGVNVDVRMGGMFFANRTPLMWASMKSHYEVAKYLIDNGADVNATCCKNSPVIVCAVWNYGDVRIVKMLVEKGADINAMHLENKQTVLTLSVNNCNTKIAEYLIDQGADVVKPNKKKSSALIYAQKYGMDDIVDLLKRHGAR